MLRHRPVLAAAACALAVILAGDGCTNRDEPPHAAGSGRAAGDRRGVVVGGVPLAEPADGFVQQCHDAAVRLGFAVPCPTELPLTAGERLDCSGSCTVGAGADETAARIFFLSLDGYDTEGGSPERVRHLVVEARDARDAPPSPCYAGVPAGTLEVTGQEVAALECPPMTADAGANIRHGEGAHVEHVLGYWDRSGVRYAVSVHGIGADSRALLEELISSIEVVEP